MVQVCHIDIEQVVVMVVVTVLMVVEVVTLDCLLVHQLLITLKIMSS